MFYYIMMIICLIFLYVKAESIDIQRLNDKEIVQLSYLDIQNSVNYPPKGIK